MLFFMPHTLLKITVGGRAGYPAFINEQSSVKNSHEPTESLSPGFGKKPELSGKTLSSFQEHP